MQQDTWLNETREAAISTENSVECILQKTGTRAFLIGGKSSSANTCRIKGDWQCAVSASFQPVAVLSYRFLMSQQAPDIMQAGPRHSGRGCLGGVSAAPKRKGGKLKCSVDTRSQRLLTDVRRFSAVFGVPFVTATATIYSYGATLDLPRTKGSPMYAEKEN